MAQSSQGLTINCTQEAPPCTIPLPGGDTYGPGGALYLGVSAGSLEE